MDFLVELFRNLSQHKDWGMQQCCNDSYSKTLKKWHGWLASSSFTVMFLSLENLLNHHKYVISIVTFSNWFQKSFLITSQNDYYPAKVHLVHIYTMNQFGLSKWSGKHQLQNVLTFWNSQVAIKLVPDRKRFLEVLGGAENIQDDMEKFCTEFSPILRGIHKFLVQ